MSERLNSETFSIEQDTERRSHGCREPALYACGLLLIAALASYGSLWLKDQGYDIRNPHDIGRLLKDMSPAVVWQLPPPIATSIAAEFSPAALKSIEPITQPVSPEIKMKLVDSTAIVRIPIANTLMGECVANAVTPEYLITAGHCIDINRVPPPTFPTVYAGGKHLGISFLAYIPPNQGDIAAIKIEPTSVLKPLEAGDPKALRRGDPVVIPYIIPDPDRDIRRYQIGVLQLRYLGQIIDQNTGLSHLVLAYGLDNTVAETQRSVKRGLSGAMVVTLEGKSVGVITNVTTNFQEEEKNFIRSLGFDPQSISGYAYATSTEILSSYIRTLQSLPAPPGR